MSGWWARNIVLFVATVVVLASCGQQLLPPAEVVTRPAPTVTPEPLAVDPPVAAPEDDTASDDASGSTTSTETSEEQATTDAAIVDAEAEWEDITSNLEGLESTCGNVHYVSTNPSREQMIVGISRQGLFAFDNETLSWNSLGSGQGSAFINNRLGWIAYDPLVSERFWQAGSYGDGVFRTDDDGATFTRLGDIENLDYVSVDVTDPERSVMMAGVHEASIIYRSEDQGATWQDISAALPADIGFTPYPVVFDPSLHLLGTYRSESAGVFRSQDAGATWSRTYDGAISGPPIIAGDNVFWLLSNGGGVIRSSDQGATFERGEPTEGAPATLAMLSDGRLVTHNNARLLISSDFGTSWRAFGPQLPYEPSGIAVDQGNDAVVIWRFTCNFDDRGNPVLPRSILRLNDAFDPS